MAAPHTAFISVDNKEGIGEFALALPDETEVYAYCNTAETIAAAGREVHDVSTLVGYDITGVPRERVAASLLYPMQERDDRALEKRGLRPIGVVCIGLKRPDAPATEKDDVGGVNMLVAAASGRRIVLSRKSHRKTVLDWLARNRPNEERFLNSLASAAQLEVAAYLGKRCVNLMNSASLTPNDLL